MHNITNQRAPIKRCLFDTPRNVPGTYDHENMHGSGGGVLSLSLWTGADPIDQDCRVVLVLNLQHLSWAQQSLMSVCRLSPFSDVQYRSFWRSGKLRSWRNESDRFVLQFADTRSFVSSDQPLPVFTLTPTLDEVSLDNLARFVLI